MTRRWPGLSRSLQAVAFGLGGDDADLLQPARKLQRPADEGRQPLGALGQGRVAGGVADQRPARGRALVGGHVEIVAKGRAKRDFVARRHRNLVHDGLEAPGLGGLQQLDEGRDLGFQALGLEPRRRCRLAGVLLLEARSCHRFLGLDDAFLDAFELGLDLGHFFAQRLDRGRGGVPGAKLRHLAGDIGFLRGEAARARIVLGDLAF